MRVYTLMLLAGLVLLAGCIQEEQTRYLCEDGKTIVTNLKDCPILPEVDEEYEVCLDMPVSSGSYYDESPRDMCFYSLAISRENISLCNKIISSDTYSEFNRASCGMRVAVLRGDPSQCDRLLTTMDKSSCYSQYAIEMNDYSICSRLSGSYEKDECLYGFLYDYTWSYRPLEWGICAEFSRESYKDECYYEAALDTYELSYCDMISGSSYYYDKAACYGEVATMTYNPSVCSRLSTVDERDDCYYHYATYNYEVSVCDQIKDEYLKNDCIEWANYSWGYYY